MVILASGLDTCPYRLWWPAGNHEIDQPEVMEFKAEVLPRFGRRGDREPLRGRCRSSSGLAGGVAAGGFRQCGTHGVAYRAVARGVRAAARAGSVTARTPRR